MRPAALIGIALCALSRTPALAAPGDLDPTFGTGGIVTTAIGTKKDASAHVLLQQPDGKLVAGGSVSSSAPGGFALARYNLDGSLDTTFGRGGTVTTSVRGLGEYLEGLVLQSDGKLVATGQVYNGSKVDFGLARYKSDGSLDSSFGRSGKVVTSISSGVDAPFALVLQPDGKLVAAGTAAQFDSSGSLVSGDLALARYNPDGLCYCSCCASERHTGRRRLGRDRIRFPVRPRGLQRRW